MNSLDLLSALQITEGALDMALLDVLYATASGPKVRRLLKKAYSKMNIEGEDSPDGSII